MEIGSSAFVHEKNCPVCGKHFAMSRIDLWAYRRKENHQDNYFCSWRCLRAWDKQKEEKNKVKGRQPALTKGQRERAINLALAGYSPISYIRSCGAESPLNQWGIIRNALKDNDPEMFERLPKTIKGLPEPPNYGEPEEAEEDEPEEAEKDEPEADDEPEAEETEPAEHVIFRPTRVSGMAVRAVEGEFGRYSFSASNERDWIDFETGDGDELSMSVDRWRGFIAELQDAARVLGVEL